MLGNRKKKIEIESSYRKNGIQGSMDLGKILEGDHRAYILE